MPFIRVATRLLLRLCLGIFIIVWRTGNFLFPITPRPKGWLSWKLYPITLLFFASVAIAFITIIETLLKISTRNQGFVTVNVSDSSAISSKNFFSRSHWNESYFWTTLPTLIFTTYKLAWTSVLREFMFRQPFVELAKPEGSIGRKTVLLDYRTYSSAIVWMYAFRNRHGVLGIAMIASFLTFTMQSIVSNLFSVASVKIATKVDMSVKTAFNESGVDSKTNYRTVFNVVSAVRVYNASFPPWTTENYSFPSFEPRGGFNDSINGSLAITAYSALMDCRNITNFGFQRQSIVDGDLVNFNTTDRGCTVDVSVPIAAGASIYMKTAYIGTCGSEFGLRRHAFVSGIVDESSPYLLSNFSFISCTTSYYQTPGTLTVNAGVTGRIPSVAFFIPNNNVTEFLPMLWDRLEPMIHQVEEFDPTATYFTDGLGQLILSYSNLISNNSLESTALLQAIEDIFTSIFSVSSTLYLFQTLSKPDGLFTGELYSSVTRLFVNSSSARLLETILAILVVVTIMMMVYSSLKGSILQEEPKGLLGLAELAHGDGCEGIVETFRRSAQPGYKFGYFIKKREYEDAIFETHYDSSSRRPRIILRHTLENRS